ncbi:hypothetical protein [Pseudomonas sp. CGJS7]|uniref:hypothetical protein n=1 Tax=Pseudomonas sp. CGJS7 TaxID=3109348 RepID=UPI00300AB242
MPVDQLASPMTAVHRGLGLSLLVASLIVPALFLFGTRAAVPGEFFAVWFALIAVLVGYCVFASTFADRVDDHGDHLWVRRGKVEHRVDMDDIAYVEAGHNTKPRRVTLHLKAAGPLGDRIVFLPRLNPVGPNATALDLERRVGSARNPG